MLIPLGILASSGGVAGSYELIASEILTGSQSSVTFSSLGDYSSTYKHLQIRAVVRTTRSANVDFLKVTFNADTTGYSRHYLYGNGSSVSAWAYTDIISTPDCAANTSTAGEFSPFVMDVLDPYVTTKNKTVRILGGNAGGFNQIGLASGLWIDTSAVSSIKFESGNSASIAQYSRFSLYGIKG